MNKNIPERIIFNKGLHRGIPFQRGTGPGQRTDIGGGVTVLLNSTNFWYAGGNRSVSGEYLEKNRHEWIEVPSRQVG